MTLDTENVGLQVSIEAIYALKWCCCKQSTEETIIVALETHKHLRTFVRTAKDTPEPSKNIHKFG